MNTEIKKKQKCKNRHSTITTAPAKWSNLNIGFKVKYLYIYLQPGRFVSALCYQHMVKIYHMCKNSPLNYTKTSFPGESYSRIPVSHFYIMDIGTDPDKAILNSSANPPRSIMFSLLKLELCSLLAIRLYYSVHMCVFVYVYKYVSKQQKKLGLTVPRTKCSKTAWQSIEDQILYTF